MYKNRTIRLFLSSTFRDFSEERDLLVRQVFPALRARLKERFVELVDVDLRWGITAEQAERGEVLPICLAEIDRARPYFIGMLGERYGWIPPADGFAADLLERQPWLKKHQGGTSVTELEILHGVLNNRRMQGRAFFYFRSPAYARAKGGDYLPSSTEDRTRQAELKRRIRARGLAVTGYATPEALAKRIERDLWRLFDAEFPATDVPDAFERERLRHDAYAAPRRRLYLGGERYQAALQRLLEAGAPRILIEGASGAGKSALLANFFDGWRQRHRKHVVHEHYLGASADAADPHALVRRLIEAIQRTTGSQEAIAADPQALMDSLPLWLATASAWARKRQTRVIIVLDALNSLSAQPDLRWWPAFLPDGITVVVSCLPGPVHDALLGKVEAVPGQRRQPRWQAIPVRALTRAQSAALLNTYLARFNKQLPAAMVRQVQAHPLATNPLFIRTLAEELRLFGLHEGLPQRLAHYLRSPTMEALFARVLQRVEGDGGKAAVRSALVAIWASRAGLAEKEILGITGLAPAQWAAIRHALDEALLDNSGRISFAHDYVRAAVADRYLGSEKARASIHRMLGTWFHEQVLDERRAFEEPWQWMKAGHWRHLKRWLDDSQVLTRLNSRTRKAEWLGYWHVIAQVRPVNLSGYYRRAWTSWSRGLDDASIITLASALQQALEFAGYQGDFEVRLARSALAAAIRLYGPEHAQTRTGKRNLAQLLDHRRLDAELDEAIALMSELAAQERKARSPALADTLNQLGSLYASTEHLDAARNAYLEALALFEAADGENDAESTASVLNNLGDLAVARGEPEQAQAWLERCVRIRSRRLPADHPLLAVALDNLGKALAEQNKRSEASAHFKRALEIRLSVLGSDHPETNNTRVNWGTFLFRWGEFQRSASHFRLAWLADAQRFGPVHPYTLMDATTCLACAREWAKQSAAQGRKDEAFEALENVRQLALSIGTDAMSADPERQAMVAGALEKISVVAAELGAADFAAAVDDAGRRLRSALQVE